MSDHMSDHLMKRFKLAVAITLSLGLGMARVLPVQAAAIAKPTPPSRSHSQPLDSYQFKLDDLALPAATKPQARAAQTPFESTNELTNLSAQPPNPNAPRAVRGDAAKGQGAIFAEGFFSLVFFATVVYIIYNLLSRGKSVAADSSSDPTTESSSSETKAIAAAETIAPPALDEKKPEDPAAVPTPALLPGLLGLSLKLFRQKKAESLGAVQ